MRLGLFALVIGLGFSSVATAGQIERCNQDIDSVVCKNYLDGVVDGALMYRGAAVGQRLETDGYESRALKYRGGKRFQEANREFCRDRIPDRNSLVSGLAEAFSAGEIKTTDDLTAVMSDLMDCQRLK